MKAKSVGFGELSIEGERYLHDVVIDAGRIGRRTRPHRRRCETSTARPAVGAEAIPWGGRQLIVGTGVDGRLPVAPEVFEEATRRGIELTVLPTPTRAASWRT